MTNLISTTKISSAKPDAAVDSTIASNNQSELVIVAPEALESLINTRRAELIFKLSELRASMQLEAVEAGDKIKARLSELSHIVKDGIVDGWANLSDTVKHKLDSWLAATAKQLAFQTKSGRSQ
jgi:hypothetical protein